MVREAQAKYLTTGNGKQDVLEKEFCPDGYKLTEVGVIPDDWDECLMSKIGESFIGLTYSPNNVKDYGTLVLRSSNVQNGQLAYENNVFVNMDLPERVITKEGDLLICVRNGSKKLIGKCTLIDKKAAGSAFGAFMSLYRSDLNNFIIYQFQSNLIQRQINEVLGATINQITNKDLASFKIVLPSLKNEQTAIAKALSDVDALITSLEKLIAKKQAIKTATMQQLLTGKKRLPGFGEGKGYKQTELGEIPEDWEAVGLGEIGQNLIGLTYSPRDVVEHGSLVLRSSNVQKNKLAFNDNVFVKMDLPMRVIVKQGDILICVRNGSRQLIGKCALIDKQTEGSAFGAFMSIYRTKYSVFIFYQFQSDIIKNQINEIMGATINQITNKDMSDFRVPMPTKIEECNAIGSLLADMDSEIDLLEKRLSKTQKIKQGMMEELLTGKTRLI